MSTKELLSSLSTKQYRGFHKKYPNEFAQIIKATSWLDDRTDMLTAKRAYVYLHNLQESDILCEVCRVKQRNFVNFNKGFGRFCSTKCQDEAARRHKHTEEAKHKIAETSKQRWADPEYKKEVSAKIKDNHWARAHKDEVISKISTTVQEKYGVTTVLQLEYVKEARRKVDDVAIQHMRETVKEKYGVDNIMYIPEIAARVRASQAQYYKEHSNPLKGRGRNKPRYTYGDLQQTLQQKNYTLLTEITEDTFAERYLKANVEVRCNTHNVTFTTTLTQLLYYPTSHQCPKCKIYTRSKGEREVADFLESLGITVVSSYKYNSKKEIDIYLPEYNIGIEYNGLYYHSREAGHKLPSYHKHKYLELKNLGIRLISIFEDEWLYKKDIVKNILKYAVHKITNKVYARTLSIKRIDDNEAKAFYENTHLQGHASSSYHVALVDGETIYAAMSIMKSRYTNNVQYELLRYSTALDIAVVGGVSKLLSYAINDLSITSLISYADARYFTGQSLSAKFKYVGLTDPDLYFTDYHKRYNRHMFSAVQRGGKTQRRYAYDLGYDQIYGIGHHKWIYCNLS